MLDYWTVRQAKDSRLMSVAGCIFAVGFALITLGAFSYHSLGAMTGCAFRPVP